MWDIGRSDEQWCRALSLFQHSSHVFLAFGLISCFKCILTLSRSVIDLYDIQTLGFESSARAWKWRELESALEPKMPSDL